MPSLLAQQTVPAKVWLSPVVTDSLYRLGDWINEESLIVKTVEGAVIPGRSWFFDADAGNLVLWANRGTDFSNYDTLAVYFERYPFSLNRRFENQHIPDFDSTRFPANRDSLADAILQRQSQNFFAETELSQRGSLSRGIVVGTNQDFTMESGLNFELSGQLTENLSLDAVLTDKNIPIQPDGTTQNLREFDRVFIQLKSPTMRLQMGDVDIGFNKSAFAKLNRRLQGAAGYSSTKNGDYGAAVSVVRGTYKSMSFRGQDGVQGPYRLQGNQNDLFVTVLAGTEHVYINGIQVQRGEENEYVIDYGLGEITFTNNLLIKDETRIVVEYQFIDRNFSRTLVAAEGGDVFYGGKLSIGATVIRQADGNDLLSQQTLTEQDIELLKSMGDKLENAQVSGVELYDEADKSLNIKYAQRDTIFNGQQYTIYANEPGAADAVYKVRFSNVGGSRGSYARAGSSVNGIIYKWVGPGNGDYEPFRTLPAPQKQQTASVNSVFQINKNVQLFGEWAVSDFDKNRFSTLDDGDNIDFSYLGGLKIEKVPTRIGRVDASVFRRFSGKNFMFFERTKEVEFDRKWNLEAQPTSDEAVNEAVFGLALNENSQLNAEYGFIERGRFKSRRQAAQLQLGATDRLHLQYQQDWVVTSDDNLNRGGNWLRQNMILRAPVHLSNFEMTPYIYGEQEKKTERDKRTDSLTSASHLFYDIGPGMALTFNKVYVDYSAGFRSESGVLGNNLKKESDALTQKLDVNIVPSSYFSNKNRIQYRTKEINQRFSSITGDTDKQSLLIRSNTSYSTISDNWNGELLYEANTKRQALYQETYLEAGPELGQYVWKDLNGDGLQQIDEFFPELSPNEGIYIRQLLPSDDLFRVIDLNLRLRNEFRPLGFIPSNTPMLGFMKQLGLKSNIALCENSTTAKLSDVYLLNLKTFQNDSTTIYGSFIVDTELDVLPEYDFADLNVRYSKQHSLNRRSNELLKMDTQIFSVSGSLKLSGSTDGTVSFTQSSSSSISNALNSRNFEIQSYSIEPGIGSTINRSWRTGFSVSYSYKKDVLPVQPVNAKLFKIRSDNRFFLFRKMQINSTMEFRNVAVHGTSTGYGMFELTDGTGRGNALIWSLSGNYRVSDLIRLSIVHDARKIENIPMVNTFKIIVNAIF